MSFDPAGGNISGADDVSLSNPQDNQVLTYNFSLGLWQNENVPAGSGGGSQSFTYTGTLQAGTGAVPFYNDSGSARTINSVRASVAVAPTGSSVIVDVNVNGTTIFPTQSERPTIAVSQATSGAVSRSASWPNGQAMTVDVDQIGSTIAGSDLVVTVEYA